MKISREVEITLTAEEVEEIIKNHIHSRHTDMDINRVYFKVTTVYEAGGFDDRGSQEMTEVQCSGLLK